MVRAYAVCHTWNLMCPDRFVADRLVRMSDLDEVVEQPKILHIKSWS
jgi:hypothetical protein